MADHKLYLPPTQSQNSNIFASSMPNLVTNDLFVLRATKCLATKLGFLAERRNQVLQVSALVIVSCVVKVFEAMTNRVVSGLTFLRTSATSVIFFPVKPFQAPLITLLQNSFMWLSTLLTAGMTFFPSTTMGTLLLFLSATWSTARSSV